jgi:hypothetical protein
MASISTTLTKNTTTNIIVGNVITDESIIINYVGRRGSYSEIGKIVISSPFLDYTDPIPYHTHDGECIGIVAAADYSGSDIRLKLTVDNILDHDIIFNYNIEVVTNDKIVSPPLGIPSVLTGVTVSLTQINLTWLNNCTNEEHVYLERSDDGGGTYPNIVELTSGTQSYPYSGLTGLTHYYFRVRTEKDGVYSIYSNIFDLWTAITPTLQSIAVSNALPTKVVLTYDYALDETSTPATSTYTVVGKTVSAVLVSGTTVTLTVSVAFTYGDSIVLSYVVPGSNPIRSSAGALSAAALSLYNVTNNILYQFTNVRQNIGTQRPCAWKMQATGGDVTFTIISGNAKFYDDLACTINEGTVRTITSGTEPILYLKTDNSTTVSYITCSDPTKITKLSIYDLGGSGTYIGKIGGDITKLINLTYIYFPATGYSAMAGDCSSLIHLAYISDSCSLSGIYGNITNMPLTYINISGGVAKLWSGDITGKALTNISISGAGNVSNLTGDIGTIPHGVAVIISDATANTYYGSLAGIYCSSPTIGGYNTLAFDLSLIYSAATTINIQGKNRIVNYTSPHTWAATMNSITIIPDVGYGLSSTEIDNLLIDLANSNWSGSKVITLTGSNAPRTSASDAAYTHLTVTHGCVITLNS